jgi:hypothetical protein
MKLRFVRFRQVILGAVLAGCCLAIEPVSRPAPQVPPPAASIRTDPLTPGSANVLAVINLRQTLATPLVRKHVLEELRRLLGREDRVVKVLRLAGLDPLTDVDTLTFAASGDITDPRLVAVVRGRFDPAKVQAAVEEFGKENPGKIAHLKEGERSIYQVRGEKTLYAAFADAGTFVLSPSKEYLLEVVRKAGEAPAPLNADMQKTVARLDGRECAWVAAVLTDQMKQALRQQDPDLARLTASLESITGRLELTGSLQLAVVIHATNAAAAGEVRKKLEEVVLPLLNFLAPGKDPVARVAKEALSSIKVATDKNDVRITLQLTEEMIQKASRKEQP